MVLKVQAPGNLTLIHLVRYQLQRWGVKEVPKYHLWVSAEKAAAILQIPPTSLLSFVSKSKIVHGILFNDNPLIVHPSSLLRYKKTQHKIKLAKIISETEALYESPLPGNQSRS